MRVVFVVLFKKYLIAIPHAVACSLQSRFGQPEPCCVLSFWFARLMHCDVCCFQETLSAQSRPLLLPALVRKTQRRLPFISPFCGCLRSVFLLVTLHRKRNQSPAVYPPVTGGTGGTGGSGAAPQLYDVNSMADFWSWLRLGFVPLVARASWAFSEELGQAQLRPFRGLLVGVGSCGAEATRAQRRGI